MTARIEMAGAPNSTGSAIYLLGADLKGNREVQREPNTTSCKIAATESSGLTAIAMRQLKKDWTLNPEAFRQFLSWLDEGVDSNGERYLEMRRRLARYFDRRNCYPPDNLADETLNRVARKLEEKGEIVGASPAHYCYIVAKFVFLEFSRRSEHYQTSLDDAQGPGQVMAGLAVPAQPDVDTVAKEKLFDCLERCLAKLQPEDRELILDYYRGEQRAKIEGRSALAARLGLTLNALSIRACRIRSKLEICVSACVQRK
jgi:DNA-directed RNA polymerase specialized sigma24 family protein